VHCQERFCPCGEFCISAPAKTTCLKERNIIRSEPRGDLFLQFLAQKGGHLRACAGAFGLFVPIYTCAQEPPWFAHNSESPISLPYNRLRGSSVCRQESQVPACAGAFVVVLSLFTQALAQFCTRTLKSCFLLQTPGPPISGSDGASAGRKAKCRLVLVRHGATESTLKVETSPSASCPLRLW
jgi:hypothetical protein